LGRRDPDWEDAVACAITEKLDFLANSPYLSAIFRANRWGEIREVLATNYRIFFTIEDEDRIVHIKRIQHARQQDPEFPE
jgi:mRNA-degrading endonuclease RelE of RelBE toxin-antitoxin system